MLVAFILIIIFILLWIMSAIYSVFSPFMESIGNVVNFNSAYYWALWGVERAELVLKYKEPWFEWSGGFLQNTTFGPKSDTITGNFGKFTSSTQNWFSRSINSRSTTIPASWNGNVDYLLASSDSSNYNKLPYFYSDKLVLSLDNTTNPNSYYTGTTGFTYFNGWVFSWILRLPPKISSWFSNSPLCVDPNISECDPDWDGVFDDMSVNRWLDWIINWSTFTILPNISVFYYSGMQVDTAQDIAIRESILNNTGRLLFGGTLANQKFNPIVDYTTNNLAQHNVVSVDASSIQNLTYNNILNNTSSITWLQFSINIVDLLRTKNNNIYPFLEYQLSFPQAVADRFYTIQWVWLVGDYNVKIFIKKSTNESSSIGDFTIVF